MRKAYIPNHKKPCSIEIIEDYIYPHRNFRGFQLPEGFKKAIKYKRINSNTIYSGVIIGKRNNNIVISNL